jgi:multiple sugar transport system ATP-binding protein
MELYNAPANRFVAGFIGSPRMNFMDASIVGDDMATAIGIRPEHISVSREGGDLHGTVSHVEHLGADTNLYLQTEAAGLVTIRMFGEHRFTIGERLFARFDPAHIYRFGADGRTMT